MITLENRLQQARELRTRGYNCAQTLLSVFPDVSGLTPGQAEAAAMGLGAGCGCGEICGVLSALALLEGLRNHARGNSKGAAYASMRKLHDAFTTRWGACRCADLKAPGKPVPCNDLIFHGIELYHNYLEA